MSTTVRNVAIIVAIAAAVAFIPGGETTGNLIAAVVSTLILAAIVGLLARFYRERQYDLDALGNRWRLLLFGALGAIVLAMAARSRLFDTGLGTLVWFLVLGGCSYVLYLVWRRHREYA